MNVAQFKTGEVIFREWSAGNEMYEIKSGTVGIYSAYGTSGEKKLTELDAGRIFGEMTALAAQPRSATAVALSDVEAEVIPAAEMREYFSSRPELVINIMRGLTRRIRELTADYQEACGTVGAWKKETERGEEKSLGLLSAIKRFAALLTEDTSYSDSMYRR